MYCTQSPHSISISIPVEVRYDLSPCASFYLPSVSLVSTISAVNFLGQMVKVDAGNFPRAIPDVQVQSSPAASYSPRLTGGDGRFSSLSVLPSIKPHKVEKPYLELPPDISSTTNSMLQKLRDQDLCDPQS